MKYIYVGGGMGVPGLPHEITEEEAKANGTMDLLSEAIRNGSYVLDDQVSAVSYQAPVMSSPLAESKKKKEVRDG